MADEKTKDAGLPEFEDDANRGPNDTIPGGAYITGGRRGKDGKHYGGTVTDSEGKVLNRFADNEVNTGKPKGHAEPAKAEDDKPALTQSRPDARK